MANEFFVRCNCRNRRFAGCKSRFLQAADGGKGIASAANELCGGAQILLHLAADTASASARCACGLTMFSRSLSVRRLTRGRSKPSACDSGAESRSSRPATRSVRHGRSDAGTDSEQPRDGQHVENAVEDVGREQGMTKR